MAGNVFRFDPQPQREVPTVPLPAAAFTPPPKIGGIQAAVLGSIIASWPALTDPRPNQFQQVQIAPLTLTYPTAPQNFEPMDDLQISIIVRWWPDSKEPRPAQFQQVSIAPLTLIYGNQPPVNPPLWSQEFQIIQSWPPIWWPQQTKQVSVGWLTAPLPYIGPNPFPYHTILSWQPATIIVLETGGVVQPVGGDLPVPIGPIALTDLIGIVQAWQPVWGPWPQIVDISASTPILPIIPPPVPTSNVNPSPSTLLAWQQPWGPWPQTSYAPTVSPAKVYGQQPPVISNLIPSPSILATWQPPWGPPPDREDNLAHLEPLPPIPPGAPPIIDDLIKGWL